MSPSRRPVGSDQMFRNRESNEDLYARALRALDAGDPLAAVELLDRAIATAAAPELFYERGRAHLQLERPDLALADYDAALSLDPKFAHAICSRASALEDLGRIEEAHAAYSLAISIDPQQAAYWFGRGDLLMREDRFAEAEIDLHRACELDPDSPEYRLRYAMALHYQSRFAEARSAYDQVLELDPRNDAALAERAICHWRLGLDLHALEDVEEALRLNSNSVYAHEYHARLLMHAERYREAFDAVQRSISFGNEGPSAYAIRAELFAKANCCDDALHDLDYVLRRHPKNAEAYELRARVYRAAGRDDLAEQDLLRRDELQREWVREIAEAGGVPVQAAVVQANWVLYDEDSEEDAFCLVLVTFDPALGGDAARLTKMAEDLYAIFRREPRGSVEEYLHSLNTDLYAEPDRRRRLPESFTGGPLAFACDLFVYRRFLPQRGLVDRLVPCVAEPGDRGRVALLPREISE